MPGFDPTDFDDFTDLFDVYQRNELYRQAREQNEKLEAIRRGQDQKGGQDQKHGGPACPACGVTLDGQFRKCKNCLADLVWVEGDVCERGQETALKRRAKQRATTKKRLATFGIQDISDELVDLYGRLSDAELKAEVVRQDERKEEELERRHRRAAEKRVEREEQKKADFYFFVFPWIVAGILIVVGILCILFVRGYGSVGNRIDPSVGDRIEQLGTW